MYVTNTPSPRSSGLNRSESLCRGTRCSKLAWPWMATAAAAPILVAWNPSPPARRESGAALRVPFYAQIAAPAAQARRVHLRASGWTAVLAWAGAGVCRLPASVGRRSGGSTGQRPRPAPRGRPLRQHEDHRPVPRRRSRQSPRGSEGSGGRVHRTPGRRPDRLDPLRVAPLPANSSHLRPHERAPPAGRSRDRARGRADRDRRRDRASRSSVCASGRRRAGSWSCSPTERTPRAKSRRGRRRSWRRPTT